MPGHMLGSKHVLGARFSRENHIQFGHVTGQESLGPRGPAILPKKIAGNRYPNFFATPGQTLPVAKNGLHNFRQVVRVGGA